MEFTFAAPGRLLFGAGRSRELAGIVAGLGSRPFVCVGSDPARFADLLESLGSPVRLHPISGEPTLNSVRTAVAAALDHGADVVVGLGGGSVIDAAKLVSALVTNRRDPLDYLEVVGQGLPLTEPCLPCVAVPTTAGTGSEMTSNGVVASPEHGVKVSLRSPTMLPRVAIVDPTLTLDCPPAVTAASGLDALTQCLEAFVTHAANPVTDGFAMEGLSRAGASLRRAYDDGSDLAARTDMSLCATLSGLALANSKLGAVHGFAGPLGGMIDAPHGAICAALLVAACDVNLSALKQRDPDSQALGRYAAAAALLTGVADVRRLLEWLRETVAHLGVGGLESLGLSEERVPEAVAKARNSSSMKGNPIELTEAELQEIVLTSL